MKPYDIEADFNPPWISSILNFIMWFVPLIVILYLSLHVMWCLRQIMKNKKQTKGGGHKKTTDNESQTLIQKLITLIFKSRLSAQTKFSIIIFSYWFQWIPPCILTIINPICDHCIQGAFAKTIYWLTFSSCAITPIVVLLLNPNVVIIKRRKK